MSEMLYVRITVGDKRVCDDCIRYENLAPATLEWWLGSGYYPRQAPTECGPKCRCGLVPSTFGELETSANALIEKAVQEGIGNTVIDLTTGRTLLLSDFENFAGLRTLQYEVIANMEDMIYQWKIANQGRKLPDEFFQLQDIEKMMQWLRGKIEYEAILRSLGVKLINIDFMDEKLLNEIVNHLIHLLKTEGYTVEVLSIYRKINGSFAWGGPGGIDFNPKYFKNFQDTINEISLSVNTNFTIKMVESQYVKAIITHEYCHVMTSKEIYSQTGLFKQLTEIKSEYIKKLNNIAANYDKQTNAAINNYNKKMQSIDPGDIKTTTSEYTKLENQIKSIDSQYKNDLDKYKISTYSFTNLHEFTAEAFAEYKHGSNPSPFSIQVGKLIDAKYKGGKK